MTLPVGPIFSEWGRDALTIVGTLGTVASLIGFGYAIWKNTKKTSEAVEALRRAKVRQDRIALLQLRQHILEANQCISDDRFQLASLRLGDAAYILSQLSDNYECRDTHAKQLYNFKNWSMQLHKGEGKDGFKGKWEKFEPKLIFEIHKHIEQVHFGVN